jgi:CDP-glucose 4,6-dehydratase
MVDLRNPEATRPWQHVLEPLSGYLTQAMALNDRQELHGESFNFGPNSTQNNTVRDLVENMANHWDKVKWRDVSLVQSGPYESGLLKLNCDKALHLMDWQAVMNFEETLKMTVQWYRSFYKSPSQSEQTTLNQIQSYTELAKNKSLVWTK